MIIVCGIQYLKTGKAAQLQWAAQWGFYSTREYSGFYLPLGTVVFVHETSAAALEKVPSSALPCEKGSADHVSWISVSHLLSGESPDSLFEETWYLLA